MMNKVIVIPCYRDTMEGTEEASLIQCSKIFGGRRDIVLAVPEKLDCSLYLKIIPSARIERFDDKFFVSVSSYSHLLLTPAFYQRFSDYDYMLIYQLDAWVFRDELDKWCAKGYEYIGAPFLLKNGRYEKIIVGNGGFSLRRIDAMLRVLQHPQAKMFPAELLWDFIRCYAGCGRYLRILVPLLKLAGLLPNTRGAYLEKIRYEKDNSEDMVFHFLSRQYTKDGLTMPDIKEAALFSIDKEPVCDVAELPFGCHAWMKGRASFWKKYIPALTENLPENV